MSFVTACNTLEPSFRQHVQNDVPGSLCLGGLRGLSGTAEVKGDSGIVAYGRAAFADWLMPQGTPTGTPVTLEAWCYGENDEEIAYIKLTRAYRDGMNASIGTMSPQSDTQAANCMVPGEADTQRGPLICYVSDF